MPLRPWSRAVGVRIVPFAFVAVEMPPEHELLEHEERQDAGEHRRGHRLQVLGVAERVRQHLEKCRAEQRADREADEHRHPLRAHRERDQRRGRRPTAARRRRSPRRCSRAFPSGGDRFTLSDPGSRNGRVAGSRRYEKNRSAIGVACSDRRRIPRPRPRATSRSPREHEEIGQQLAVALRSERAGSRGDRAGRTPRGPPRRPRRRAARSPARARRSAPRRHAHARDRLLDHAGRHAAPPRMGDRDDVAAAVASSTGMQSAVITAQTTAGRACTAASALGAMPRRAAVGVDHTDAMHLPQPHRIRRERDAAAARGCARPRRDRPRCAAPRLSARAARDSRHRRGS